MADQLIIFDTDAARRRAVARRVHDQGREAAHRAPAGAAAGGRDRGRFRRQLQRRLRGGTPSPTRDQGLDHLLAVARERPRHRAPPRRLKGAGRARIHTFIATSPLHMEKKLRMTPEQVLEQAKQSVRFARNLCGDIEFSPEDGYRSEVDFLCRVLETVIKEGRDHHQRARHRGLCRPRAVRQLHPTLRERIPNSTRRSGPCIATTTWAWRWPTRWPASRSAAPARSSAPSTAGWASGPATVRWKRS